MRDRTFEKPRSAGTASTSSGSRRPAGNAGVAQFTQNFFQEVKETRDMIKTLQEYVNRLGSVHDRMLNAIREAERIAYQRKSDALSKEVDGLARTIRSRLQAMEQLMQPGSQQYTMMKSQRTDIARKFRDVVMSYHDIQMRLQSSEKQQLERQIRIVNPAASNEDIQRMVDEQSGPVFSQTILQSTRRDEARRVLQEVEERHAHIVDLSKSIIEIQKLFENLSAMIEAQDSLVTQISANVNDVEANTQQATTQLQGAIKSAKSARRKRWCLICFFFILLLAVGLYCLFQYYLIPQVFNPQPTNNTSNGGQAKSGKMISGVSTDESGSML